VSANFVLVNLFFWPALMWWWNFVANSHTTTSIRAVEYVIFVHIFSYSVGLGCRSLKKSKVLVSFWN
jgi:hypothetical protein